MCPVLPREVIDRSRQQVEALFDQFMKLNPNFEDYLPKRQSFGGLRTNVQYDTFPAQGCLERDSGKGPQGNKKSRPISRGSDNDIESLCKRPGAPAPGSPPPQCLFDSACPPPLASGTSAVQGPTDQQIHDAALKIAEVGDEIEKKYGDKMNDLQSQITSYINSATTFSYTDLARHINSLVNGGNTNWITLAMLFHVGKRVLLQTGTLREEARLCISRYVASTFAEHVAQHQDVVQFITDRPTTL